MGLLAIGTVTAQGADPSASRMFDTSSVPAAGGSVVVTITVTGATTGVVIEDLPGGFSYESSSLDDSQVRINGQEISFILTDSADNPFTYTVMVSQTGSISGKLVADRVDYGVTGQSTVTAQDAAPSAAPSASRMFDTSSVPAAGGSVVVTITVTGAATGVVIEDLPAGFSYESSSLDDSQVRINGQEISFILTDSADNPFTYTVMVSQTGSISGKLVADRVDYGVTGASTVTAQDAGPSASRMFDTSSVPAAGGSVVVTITVTGAATGVVIEDLPGGFSYESSSLDDSQVRINGQEISFILTDSADNPFTYTVMVSQTGSISGKLVADRVDYGVTGASTVTVEAEDTTPPPSSDDVAPVFTSDSAISVEENTIEVMTVTATDGDTEDPINGYNITGGADEDSFSLVRNTGVLFFNTAPDFENPADADADNVYEVRVTVDSGSGARRDTAFTTIAVTVTDMVDEDTCIADLGALTDAQTVMGAWASDCPSTARTGRYARYYSFTLDSSMQVEMNLTSPVDAYLALRQGAGRTGTLVASNDNVGSRNFNSAINMMLAAGTYTVEATTYYAGQTGDFTLSVRPLQETEDLGTLTGSVDRSNSMWTSDFMSTQQAGSYARSYTFTVNTATHVAINLTSPEDAYLYVLDSNGAVVHENDNVTTRNLNSRIDETLAAGMYTIEATTYHPARMGTFHLSIGVLP